MRSHNSQQFLYWNGMQKPRNMNKNVIKDLKNLMI